MAWKNKSHVRVSCLIWTVEEKDGKKNDGSYAYVLEREGEGKTKIIEKFSSDGNLVLTKRSPIKYIDDH